MSLNVIGLPLENGKEIQFQVPSKEKKEFFVSFKNDNEENIHWDIKDWEKNPSNVLGDIFKEITKNNNKVYSMSEYGDDLYFELANGKLLHFNESNPDNPGLNYINVYDIVKEKSGIPQRNVKLNSFSMNDFANDPKGSMEYLMSYMTANNPDAYMVKGKVAEMAYRNGTLIYGIKSSNTDEEMYSQFKVSKESIKRISYILYNGGTHVGDMKILSELQTAMHNEYHKEKIINGRPIFIDKDMPENVFITIKNAIENQQSIFVSYEKGWEYYPDEENEKNAYCSDDGLAHIYDLGITPGEKPVFITMEHGENWGSPFSSSGIKKIATSENFKELIDMFVEYEVESAVERTEKELRNEIGSIINKTISGYDKVKNGEDCIKVKTEDLGD